MKKVLLGAVLGTAIFCLYKKMHHTNEFGSGCDDLSKLSTKAKKKFKDVFDSGKNQAEYLRDRAEYEVNKGANKLDDMMD